MLDGSKTKLGKIWKKVILEFNLGNQNSSSELLVCDIGEHNAILGLPWLTKENPNIDWKTGELYIPKPNHILLTMEEEADIDPLSKVLEQYHEFAKVFGEEEFHHIFCHHLWLVI
ncbi:hypothetical protein RSAG8_07331, partial [Rhizoctonia solani AG-8 WAC10335]